MLYDLASEEEKKEEIREKVEEIKREVGCFLNDLNRVIDVTEKDYLNYPSVSIAHLQMHIGQLNQLTRSVNDKKEYGQ